MARIVPLLAVLAVGCATTRPASGLASGPAWVSATGDAPSLEGRHVVFVAGFMSELIPGYFTDNVAVTRELGGATSTLFPPSSRSLTDDVLMIEAEVRRTSAPVVLVGHSKGGAGVLLTVLRNPELVLSGRVECVIVLQGALGGSPLADALTSVRLLRAPGLSSLSTQRSRDTFRSALDSVAARLSEAERAFLFSRVFYVRSAHRHSALAAELALTELILRPRGENDGLLPPSEMKLNEGVDLGVLDADHAALTVSSFLSVTTPGERRAFTTALYREVGRRLGW
ncbi:MAG: hypothetical protein Q8L48_03895 [Archangium sp.]|nr:hypothetical protein [Archangium sp.]